MHTTIIYFRVLIALAILMPSAAMALNGADVAIYNGRGTWADGVTAIENMLRAGGFTCEKVSAAALNSSPQNFATLYSVILVPGGYAYYYNQDVNAAGKQRIRSFVSQGGGYFGICAGAFFACDNIVWEGVSYGDAAGYNLNLFPGTGIGPANDIANWNTVGYNMSKFRFNGNTPPLANYKSGIYTEDILYYGGPWFSFAANSGVTTLGVYASPCAYNGKPAAVSCAYGRGRVVLLAPHPEIEEDSIRDGVTIAREAQMSDNGSDWDFAASIVRWLARGDVAAMAAKWRMTRPADFNGDGAADLAVYNPNNGQWFVQTLANPASSLVWAKAWGFAGATPAPADYDGDGVADLAVYYPPTGGWFIYSLKKNLTLAWDVRWGLPTAIPVPADYNGDGRAELAVFNPPTAKWYIMKLSNRAILAWDRSLGYAGCVPVPGDYNGDRRCDLGVYSLRDGKWYIQQLWDPAGALAWGVEWGIDGAIPVPRDYNRNGACDLAVYDRYTGRWYITDLTRTVTIASGLKWGFKGAVPVSADYNGGGRADLGVYSPVTAGWYIYSLLNPTGALANDRRWGFGGGIIIGATYY